MLVFCINNLYVQYPPAEGICVLLNFLMGFRGFKFFCTLSLTNTLLLSSKVVLYGHKDSVHG